MKRLGSGLMAQDAGKKALHLDELLTDGFPVAAR
jgi:hypothetical protein